jgi:MFS family permease
VLVLRHGAWQDSWWSAAVLGAVLSAVAWSLRPSFPDDNGTDRGAGPPGHRWFTLLLLAYTLEGVGYIIAGTFLGVATVALATGAHLRTPRAVAILTTGYSAGQIAGPVLVTPMLHHSYHPALLAGAAIVTIAAVAALLLRRRFPHYLGPVPSRVRAAR